MSTAIIAINFVDINVINSGKRKRRAPSPVALRRTFPNLCVSKLSEIEIRKMLPKLYLQSSNLSCKFAELYCDLYQSLEERNIPKKHLITCVIGLEAFPPVYKKPELPLFKDQKPRLLAAEDIAGIWTILKDYCSYFNYYIIEHITNKLGTEKDKLQMLFYKEAFVEYLKHRMYECPAEVSSTNDDDCTIIVKLDESYDDCTAKQLVLLEGNLCDIFGLSCNGVLRLCTVEQGCYELTFQVPAFVQRIIFPLTPEQEAALKNLRVVWLLCGDYEFSSKKNNVRQHTNFNLYCSLLLFLNYLIILETQLTLQLSYVY